MQDEMYEAKPAMWARYSAAAMRIALGFIFLWAFLDKTFGLGYSTPSAKSWLNGGNPTMGYLNSSTGPLADVFKAMAGSTIVNMLFMLGLLGVGVSMMLGIGTRIGGWTGALMVSLMWLSHPPWTAATPAPNPVVDDHIVYLFAFVWIALSHAGHALGLGDWWTRQPMVQKMPALE